MSSKPEEERTLPPEIIIEIDVSAFHDVRVLREGEAVAEGTPLVSIEREGETRTAVKTLREEESTTQIVIPAADAERMIAAAQTIEPNRNWRRIIADHIERNVMPFHAPSDRWKALRCNNPELEKYLQTIFFA